jgi:hypothetical protein
MISLVPQPGHCDVPSLSGRAQAGQLKIWASTSPIACFDLRDKRFVVMDVRFSSPKLTGRPRP